MGTPRLDGFDVSHYQEDFPWDHSRSLGCTLGSAKATQGVAFVDPKLARNRAEMLRTGHRYRGLYHWITPGVPAVAQLANFERAVGELAEGECVQLDCEQDGISIDDMAAAWQAWSARYPGRVIIYAGAFLNGWQAHPALAGAPWWLAWYRTSTWDELELFARVVKHYTFPWQPTVWQWGGGANGVVVSGIAAQGGHVDSNQILRVDVLEALCAYTAAAPTDTVAPDRPADTTTEGDLVEFFAHNTTTGEVAYVAIDGAGTEVQGAWPSLLAARKDLPTLDVDPPVWADLLAHRAARLPIAPAGATTVTVPEIPIHLTVSAG